MRTNNIRLRYWLFALAFGLLLVVACTKGAPTPTSTPRATQAETVLVTEGKQLFDAKGCAVCHGQNAEGSAIAPGLPGHMADQVKRQVRTPRFQMPAFGPSQVSDEDLGKIAAYIESLGPTMAHVEPVAMPGLVAMHHWMAVMALDVYNADEADHHSGHIIELLEDPEHRHEVEEARELLAGGDLHEAEHKIEKMLAGKAVFGLTLDKLHLQLTQVALEAKELEDVEHHLKHFLGQASPAFQAKGQEMLELLAAQRLHDLEEEINELLGLPGHQ